MSTIESLDLASLTNNPQSIAEALEDALETTAGTIGSLKTSAQDDHDHIEGLRSSAQSDHDAIEAMLGNTTAEHHFYTSGFSNNWTVYNWTSNTNDEDGIRVYRMGKIYIFHLSIVRVTGTGEFYETVLNLGSHITHPSNTIYLGNGIYANSSGSQHEYYIASNLDTNGDLNIRIYNDSGADSIVFTTMMGMDVN